MTITLNLHISHRAMRVIALLLILSGAVSSLYGAKDSLIIKNDSSVIILREPDRNNQEKIFADEEWKYITEAPKQEQEKSWFDRLLDNILRSLFEDMGEASADPNSGTRMNWWTIFFIIVGAGLIVFFILKATGTGGNLLFKGKSKRKERVDATLEDVDIHGIEYETEIAGAKSKGDYRFAVRLWFLRSLKDMADHELIKWKIDKTNSDYYYELSGHTLQKEFGSASLLYDYIWYGDFEIDEKKYNSVENELRTFYTNVKKAEAKE